MSHWYTQEQLVREHHADLPREATHHSPARRGGRAPADRSFPEAARTWIAAAAAGLGVRAGLRLHGRERRSADRQPGAACALPGVRPMAMALTHEQIPATAPRRAGATSLPPAADSSRLPAGRS